VQATLTLTSTETTLAGASPQAHCFQRPAELQQFRWLSHRKR
jgi:hypothetical protein